MDTNFYDSFNARFMGADQIASSFVPSRHFEELCGGYHSLLIGPRGSGKTTLLKMLQPSALAAWQGADAAKYREIIDYTGAFIPADISWGAQLDSLGYGALSSTNHRSLSIAAFTTHVFRALAEAFSVRSSAQKKGDGFRRVRLSATGESQIVRAVSEVWRVNPEIYSLLALRQVLSRRLVNIGLTASRGALLEDKEFASEVANTDFLHLNCIQGVVAAVEIFNDAVSQPQGKWALLFDEIEIAPTWIQDELMRSFRSVDHRILIKIAISPVSSSARLLSSTELAPAGREDIREVQLWHPEKKHSYEFCRNLWASILRRRGYEVLDPVKALGNSYFDPEDGEEHQDVYGPGSAWGNRFKRLADRDGTFRQYLVDQEIDPDAIHKASARIRDTTIRKIAPLVAVREYFRSPDGTVQRKRSRKTETIYAGADSLFAITEGNPRWFIGIASPLLAKLDPKSIRIPDAAQAAEIEAASTRFLSMLRTIPIPASAMSNEGNPLTDLLEKIGDYFFSRVVLDPFMQDPPLCFFVDDAVSATTERLLEIALNSGAIVYVPERGGKLALPSLRGMRFRLSYLLASKFRLPLRLGKEIALTTILDSSEPKTGELF